MTPTQSDKRVAASLVGIGFFFGGAVLAIVGGAGTCDYAPTPVADAEEWISLAVLALSGMWLGAVAAPLWQRRKRGVVLIVTFALLAAIAWLILGLVGAGAG